MTDTVRERDNRTLLGETSTGGKLPCPSLLGSLLWPFLLLFLLWFDHSLGSNQGK